MKSLKLNNSLTNSLSYIKIKKDRKMNIYLCGPTVYDEVHIGNMRPSLFFDVIVRLLREINIEIKYVQNITDIDDKIIEKAKKENRTEKEISDFYKGLYLELFEELNLVKPNFCSVTENMEEIKSFIKSMIKNKDAYLVKENILFDIRKNEEEYGKLSKQILSNLSKEKKREIEKLDKKNREDFVLWKNPHNGIKWKSLWFEGRPGWHTECATLIDKYFFKKTIDVHGGGKDLLFPHHENERIQYLAVNKKELSKVWIHFGHLKIKKEKMSKSLGNFIKAKEFIKNYGPNVLKVLILNSKYNEDIEVSNNVIKQSEAQTRKISNILKKINLFLYLNKVKKNELKNYDNKKKVIDFLLNNLETTKVFYVLNETITIINKEIDKRDFQNKEMLKKKINDLFFILEVIGLDFSFNEYDKETIELIDLWVFYSKKKRDFIQADKIRNLLQKKMII